MDVQNELFETAARLAGASAMLRERDDYDSNDDLVLVDRLVRNAFATVKAAAEGWSDGKPEVTR